ncbi:MAG: FxsA family protein [Rhizobiales bacterium]|nr:FxsA family protein [Hyphomicrobiales bacterium]NRB15202.1 FxsA family protein [Hyphomicrobiales bacterium]
MALLLLFIFIAVPVIEIGLFIQVGGAIGLLATLAVVVVTAVIGTYLLRLQGLNIVMKVQSQLQSGQMPVQDLIHGAFIVVAGLLLLTPGLFTDFIGFSLFIPQVRLALGQFIGQQFKRARTHKAGASFEFHSQQNYEFNRTNEDDIEGEFSVVEDIIEIDVKQSEPKDKKPPTS